jgi:hypothetical protein
VFQDALLCQRRGMTSEGLKYKILCTEDYTVTIVVLFGCLCCWPASELRQAHPSSCIRSCLPNPCFCSNTSHTSFLCCIQGRRSLGHPAKQMCLISLNPRIILRYRDKYRLVPPCITYCDIRCATLACARTCGKDVGKRGLNDWFL